jgi:hypothetical protein
VRKTRVKTCCLFSTLISCLARSLPESVEDLGSSATTSSRLQHLQLGTSASCVKASTRQQKDERPHHNNPNFTALLPACFPDDAVSGNTSSSAWFVLCGNQLTILLCVSTVSLKQADLCHRHQKLLSVPHLVWLGHRFQDGRKTPRLHSSTRRS